MKLQELESKLNSVLEPSNFRGRILEIAKFCKGYKETWLHFLDELKEMKNEISDEEKQKILSEIIEYAEKIAGDARVKIMKLGITISHPFDRAFEHAFQSNGNGFCSTEEFLQNIYNESLTAAETIRKIIQILESESEDPECAFYAQELKKIKNSDAAKRLSHRGVTLKDPLQVQKHTFIEHQIDPHEVRASALKKYAELSTIEREQFRIEQAEKKNWLYAGRRRNEKDMKGHHPFFSSIYAANYARILDKLKINWMYSEDAFFIRVPKEEKRVSQKSLMIEPEFYLPDENQHLLLVPDRRFVNNGCCQSSLPERMSRAKVAKDLLKEKEISIKIIQSEVLKATEELAGAETLPQSEYKAIGREKNEGDNIQNNPEKFLLEKCPCHKCNQ